MPEVAGLLPSALAFYGAGAYGEAERKCREMLNAVVEVAGACHLLGRIATRRSEPSAAVEWFRSAVAAAPDDASYRLSLAAALALAERHAEAVGAYQDAIRLDPGNPGGYGELATVLRRLGRLEERVSVLEELVKLKPDDVATHLQLFDALHRVGSFDRGWMEYEWRTRSDSFPSHASPLWDGSPLTGKTLLIIAEQGLGDQVQFVRCARFAKERGARVVLQCDIRVLRLLATCPWVDEAVSLQSGEVPHHDVYALSGSLLGLMGITLDTIPATIPYVFADPDKVARWRSILARFEDDLLIGINWEGNRSNIAGRDRAIPLNMFFPLGKMEGVRLFSLQKDDGRDQLATLPGDVPLIDLGQHFGDLASTAAAMEALNLVITSDTSLAHVAGALGRPIWLILHNNACWRWLDDREDSPWYPTMRIFRQGWNENWADVSLRVQGALRMELARRAKRFRVAALALS